MCPCSHSTGSRTSSSTVPSGSGSASSSTLIPGICIVPPTSLQQSGHAPVGERLAAGLAVGTVLEARVGERDLAHHVAAHGAGLAGAPVHREVALLLALELAGGQPARPVDGVAE